MCDNTSTVVNTTIRYKKLHKKVSKGELNTEDLYQECIKLGIKGIPTISIVKEKSREFAKHDYRLQDIRNLLLSLLFNDPIPKFIQIKNKPYIRNVIVINVLDIDDPQTFLSDISTYGVQSVKISNSVDYCPKFISKLLSFSHDEVNSSEDFINNLDTKSIDKYNQYVLNYSLLNLWGFPLKYVENEVFDVTANKRIKLDNSLTIELVGVTTGVLPTIIETEKFMKELSIFSVIKNDKSIDTGYYETLDKKSCAYNNILYNKCIKPYNIISIDCEMCDTTNGYLEVTRVSIVDENNTVLLDTLVKPNATITNYRTEYSGMNEEILRNVTITLAQVQLFILNHITSDTIIVGHSLDHDLKVLKIIHHKCIDTSILYPHSKGFPYKHKLKFLAQKYLQLEIQRAGRCHDSIEDAIAAMQLLQVKVNNGPMFGLPNNHINSQRISIFSHILENSIDKSNETILSEKDDCNKIDLTKDDGIAGISTSSSEGLGNSTIKKSNERKVVQNFYCLNESTANSIISLHSKSNTFIKSNIDECINDIALTNKDVINISDYDPIIFSLIEFSKNNLNVENTNINEIINNLTIKLNELDRHAFILITTQPDLTVIDNLHKKKKACMNTKSVSVWTDELEMKLKETISQCNIGHITMKVI